MRCSKGTYVRVLIEDLAAACGSEGHMTALRRVAAWRVYAGTGGSRWEAMRARAEEGTVQQVIRPVESLFENLRAVQVSPAQSVRFQNGGGFVHSPGARMPQRRRMPLPCVRPRTGVFWAWGAVHAQEGLLTVLRLFPGE